MPTVSNASLATARTTSLIVFCVLAIIYLGSWLAYKNDLLATYATPIITYAAIPLYAAGVLYLVLDANVKFALHVADRRTYAIATWILGGALFIGLLLLELFATR